MGWLSDACSSVGSFFSDVGSAISSGISSAASWCGEKFSTLVNVGKVALDTVGDIAGNLLQDLGLFGKQETPENIGDRALQADAQGIFPDTFDDFSDYMEKLRNFELDPEQSKVSTVDQKIFKGLEVAGRALEDKFNAPTGNMANIWVLAGTNPDYFTSERFQYILNSGMDVASIVDYFEGTLGGGEALEIEDQLVNIDRQAHPDKNDRASREEIHTAVESAKNILN